MATPNLWYKGHLNPTWDHEYMHLKYRHEPFNDQATVRSWQKMGHFYQCYTGDMLDMRDNLPAWCYTIGDYFQFEKIGLSLYCMPPGRILPLHSDTYTRYKSFHKLPEDFSNIYRAIVFLDDWRSGHYLEVDGTAVVDWKKGDFVVWRYDVPHLAANIGSENRYTLQVTGIQ